MVIATIQANAGSLLRLARRYSMNVEDAEDAYQRALEIFIRRADTLDPAGALSWLRTVVKHEALAVRESRKKHVSSVEVDFDVVEARRLPSEDERIARFDHLARSAEALQRLKPQEVRALVLKAQGHSYAEICRITGWSYTKVNRCLTEGRRSFLERYAAIESGRECERWAPVLSAMADGEASAKQLIQIRPHLRHCAACRARVRAFRRSPRDVAALVPIGALAASDPSAPDVAGNLMLRAYEAVAGGVQERAAVSAQKLHATVEAAVTGKVAAVAASAAALAGGGVAAVHDAGDRPASLAPAASDEHDAGNRPDGAALEGELPLKRPPTAVPSAADPPGQARDDEGEQSVSKPEAEFGFEQQGDGDAEASSAGAESYSGSGEVGAAAPQPSRPVPPPSGGGGAGGEFGP